ncbi:MAG: DNA sulfur modification protein DndD [Hungatella sp.]|jgi:DNA sulfur modification protein DndD|nr:DNA sulfur modification protein DndD [Hungatella sp.]
MIIKKLVMHNFGVYASTNILKFHGNKPVVLIGGMNGRGKTTILEAVLLALYGSNSFAYRESKFQTYGQYLKSYVNKSDNTLESYVEIEFTMDRTESEVYFVHREWEGKGQRVRERIWVKRNGEENAFLTENWPMFVENILPSALSNFFFFDGEKIAELAVEDTSEQMKESIKAMLGISVLDVLEGDIGKIISKIGRRSTVNQDLQKLEELRQEKNDAIKDLEKTDREIAEISQLLIALQAELENKNTEYSVKGGDVIEQKHDLMSQRHENMSSLISSQELLIDMAGGELPLLMVTPLLNDIQKQGEVAHEQKVNHMALEKIQNLYDVFSDKTTNTRTFVDFIKEKMLIENQEDLYKLSDSTLYQVISLNNGRLENSAKKAKKLLAEKDRYQSRIKEIDNYLSVDIDEKALSGLFKRIKSLEKEIIEKEVELESLNSNRKTLHGVSMAAESKFNKMAESVLTSLETVDADERTLKYAHMAIEIISLYRIRLQERKTDLLAKTMTDCYKKLANKKNMVEKIVMDSETLDLRYLSDSGEEVAKKRLSAGEKQLMVISLLWALAICSKKRLPVIIDTPLSRLDSSHRQALVKIYFPNASDQTIILSTDSEIDETYYELIRESVGDEYTLKYSDKDKKTTIESGYFSWGGVVK